MTSEMWQRIKAARTRAGLTQEQLGEACGVSKAAVAQWEAKSKDKRTSPSRANILKIHVATRAPLDWLYNDKADIEQHWSVKEEPKIDDSIATLLDTLAARIDRADPAVREEIMRLTVRYLENPDAGVRIARAIETLLEENEAN